MARQGLNNSVAFRLPIVGVVLAVLFLFGSGWCACREYRYTVASRWGYYSYLF